MTSDYGALSSLRGGVQRSLPAHSSHVWPCSHMSCCSWPDTCLNSNSGRGGAVSTEGTSFCGEHLRSPFCLPCWSHGGIFTLQPGASPIKASIAGVSVCLVACHFKVNSAEWSCGWWSSFSGIFNCCYRLRHAMMRLKKSGWFWIQLHTEMLQYSQSLSMHPCRLRGCVEDRSPVSCVNCVLLCALQRWKWHQSCRSWSLPCLAVLLNPQGIKWQSWAWVRLAWPVQSASCSRWESEQFMPLHRLPCCCHSMG